MDHRPTVFFCYAKEDKHAIDSVYIQLKEAGLRPWMDKPPAPYRLEGLQPGEYWQSRIHDVIGETDYFLAFLSPTSVAKEGFVQREYRLALNRMNDLPQQSIFLIPVLLAPCHPPKITVGTISFADVQWYELYERGAADLIQYIERGWALSREKRIALGKRLVVDFGTSNNTLAAAAEPSPPSSRVIDIGAGTVTINYYGLEMSKSDYDKSFE